MTSGGEHSIHFKQAGGGKFGRVEIEKNNPTDICVAFLFDRTASREDTIDGFKRTFAAQMADLKNQTAQLTTVGDVKAVICTYTTQKISGDRYEDAISIGRAVPIDQIPAELDKITCQPGRTRIAHALTALKGQKRNLPKIHGVVVIGDTTDGDRLEKLHEVGLDVGKKIPIVTLYEKTEGKDGTKNKDIEAMRVLSEASGVTGCPIRFDGAMYVIKEKVMPIVLASAGPEVLAEARDKGMILPEAEGGVAAETLDKIAKPTPFYQRLGALKRHWKIPAAIGAIGVLFGLLSQCPPQKKPVPGPVPDAKKIVLPAPVTAHFALDSTEVKPGDAANLEKFADAIRGLDKGSLVIEGHASVEGSESHNRALSSERASAVGRFLRSHGIYFPIRLEAQGKKGATPETREADRNATVTYDPN